MGWAPSLLVNVRYHKDVGVRMRLPHFSKDIAAAWSVVEKMRAGDKGVFDAFCDDLLFWHYALEGDRPAILGMTAPEAAERICLAALAAVGQPWEGDDA